MRRACLHVQDLEIEAAGELGMLARSRALSGSCRRGYGWLLRRFDLVSTIAERMRRRLAAHGVARGAALPVPELGRHRRDPAARRRAAGCARKLGFGDDQVVVLYAGNMGEKQGLEGLAAVADRLAGWPAIQFVLCGAGAARARLERLLARRPNVTLLPLQPRERLNDLLNLADIHILPQRAEAASFALPSKLGGMLASGRPVVAQTDGGELARAARAGGVAVAPGDPAAMAGAILRARRRRRAPPPARPRRPAVRRDPSRSRADHPALRQPHGGASSPPAARLAPAGGGCASRSPPACTAPRP